MGKLTLVLTLLCLLNLQMQMTSGGKSTPIKQTSNHRYSPYQKPTNSFAPPNGWKPGTPVKHRIPITSTSYNKPGAKTALEKRKVNSDGANNNCAYCTAAGVGGTTVNRMVKRDGAPMYMGSEHINSPADIARINRQSGFPRTKMTTVGDENDLRRKLQKDLQPGQTKTYGLAYPHVTGAGGHVVAMTAYKAKTPGAQVQARIIDYQQSPANRYNTKPEGREYHLFDFGKKQS